MASQDDVRNALDDDRSDGCFPWPTTGPGAKAAIGRRLGALCLDWALSWCVGALVVGQSLAHASSWVPLVAFAVENVLLVSTLGTTIGHRLFGIEVRVHRTGGSPPGLPRALVRTALLCLVIPAVVWDSDGRGVHDKAAGTVIVRR